MFRTVLLFVALYGAAFGTHAARSHLEAAQDAGVPSPPPMAEPPAPPVFTDADGDGTHSTPSDLTSVQAPLPGDFLLELSDTIHQKQQNANPAPSNGEDLSRMYEQAMSQGPQHRRDANMHFSEERAEAAADAEGRSAHRHGQRDETVAAEGGSDSGFVGLGLLEEQSTVRSGVRTHQHQHLSHRLRNRDDDHPPAAPRAVDRFDPAGFSFLNHVGESTPADVPPSDPLALMRFEQQQMQSNQQAHAAGASNDVAQQMATQAGLPGLPAELPPMVPLPDEQSPINLYGVHPQLPAAFGAAGAQADAAAPQDVLNEDAPRFRAQADSAAVDAALADAPPSDPSAPPAESTTSPSSWNDRFLERAQGMPPMSNGAAPDAAGGPPVHHRAMEGDEDMRFHQMMPIPPPQAPSQYDPRMVGLPGMPPMRSPGMPTRGMPSEDDAGLPDFAPAPLPGLGSLPPMNMNFEQQQAPPAGYMGAAFNSPAMPPTLEDLPVPPSEMVGADVMEAGLPLPPSLLETEVSERATHADYRAWQQPQQALLQRRPAPQRAPLRHQPAAVASFQQQQQQQQQQPHPRYHPQAKQTRPQPQHHQSVPGPQRLQQRAVTHPGVPHARGSPAAVPASAPAHHPAAAQPRPSVAAMRQREQQSHRPPAASRNLLYHQGAHPEPTSARRRIPPAAFTTLPPPPRRHSQPPTASFLETRGRFADEADDAVAMPAPVPINRSPNNILDASFWNQVRPLPVVAVEAAANPMGGFPSAMLDVGEQAMPLTPTFARGAPSMQDLDRYDNFDRVNPLRPTVRDMVFSRATRAQQHVEPVLPDLPAPPVVLG